MNPINIGASGAGKWFNNSCVHKDLMVVENRYVVSQGDMIRNFWDVFGHCVANDIRQIITIDLWHPDRLRTKRHHPISDEELRQLVTDLRNILWANRVPPDLACFQLDNEPAKYGMHPVQYCHLANVIHSALDRSYDLYVGGEEVSYRDFYSFVVPNSANQGIAFHLQNCARDERSTDDSVNFINHLAKIYGKKTTCSEGNYRDPSQEYSWRIILHHIKRCRDIGAKDYCVIFLELRHHSRYAWLSMRFDGQNRGPYYPVYIQMSRDEKERLQKGVIDGMIIRTIGAGANDVKSGYGVGFMQELLAANGFMDISRVNNLFDETTDSALRKFQEGLVDKYPNISVDGRCGRQTFRYLIQEITDEGERRDFELGLHVIMSPYNTDGDT